MPYTRTLAVSLLLLAHLACHSQSYKGIFFGTNFSKTLNIRPATNWHLGWHLGYAMRGDLSKNTILQLEFMTSFEGFNTSVRDIRTTLAYLKAPLLVNFVLDPKKRHIRILIGPQPTFYMGGFTKVGHTFYRPRIWREDDKQYQQPSFGAGFDTEGEPIPRNWNLEAVFGIEVYGEHQNFGIRANVGTMEKYRFRNSGLSIRLGF